MQKLQDVAEGILGTSIALDTPLMEAGLDSIGAVELRNAVSSFLGVDLPATVTFDYPSLQALAGYILSKLGAQAPGGAQRGSQMELESEVQRITARLKQVAEGEIGILCGDDN